MHLEQPTMSEKLKFLARGTACVPDPHGTDANPQRRRVVGRVHKEVKPGTWAWVPTEEPDALEYHHDLRKAVVDGELWPADEATAKALRVQFDPTFGKAAEDAAAEAAKNAPETTENHEEAGETGGKGDA